MPSCCTLHRAEGGACCAEQGSQLTMGRYSAGLSTSAEASSGAPYTGWLRWPMSTRSRSFCRAS